MREELHHIAEIEQYLEGKMGADERALFEQKMSLDESLRANVELQRQLTHRIKIDAFRNEIANFHHLYTDTAAKTFKGSRFNFNSLLLFGLVGILVAGSVYYFVSSSTDPIVRNNIVAEEPLMAQPANEPLISGTTVAAEKNPNEPAAAVQPENILPERKSKNDQSPAPPVENTPLRNFLLTFHTGYIDATTGGEVVTNDSRSTIHFPAGILQDEQGNEIKGKVEIRYREYRNAAQMAFSQIPMVYNEGGKKYRFSSAGMFEIRAYQDGHELKIKPGTAFRVDYNVTQPADSCFFFALDDETQAWKKLRPIKFEQPEEKQEEAPAQKEYKPLVQKGHGQIFIKVKDAANGKNISEKIFVKFLNPRADINSSNTKVDSGYNVSTIVKGTYDILLTSEAGHRKLKLQGIKVAEGKITYVDAFMAMDRSLVKDEAVNNDANGQPVKEKKRWFFRKKKNKNFRKYPRNSYSTRNSGDKMVSLQADLNAMKDIKPDTGWSKSEAGHYIPNLVQGLQCESFGVYNCDQVYRLQEAVVVNATYQNAGKTITNGYVVSMIDLAYNAAFSFHPDQFTCNRNGKNVVLLFTTDKKLYVLPEEDYRKMNMGASGNYTLHMTEITDKVRNTEELRQYLGLKAQ